MKVFRTGILDDHPLFAEGIGGILSHYPWIDIVFAGQSGQQLTDYLSAKELDLLFLDISLHGENGLNLLAMIQKKYPGTKVIILTTHQPADIGLSMDSFTGDAYILKISGRKVLEDALTEIQAGRKFLDPNLIQFAKREEADEFQLTKREKEIIALITSGKTTKEIAEMLFLSEMTIKTHRRNISEKLGGKNMSDLIYKMNQLNQNR